MYTISVLIRCPAEQTELHAELLDEAECLIEERIGLALLELFGIVYVDRVNVEYISLQDDRGNTHSSGP